ncbi:hypothetical protein EDB87DRAFT_1580859 [Lactarius vividus]|nr:hypothetical protein EDB87DRAFT_1580859 [Lactarius vividus]
MPESRTDRGTRTCAPRVSARNRPSGTQRPFRHSLILRECDPRDGRPPTGKGMRKYAVGWLYDRVRKWKKKPRTSIIHRPRPLPGAKKALWVEQRTAATTFGLHDIEMCGNMNVTAWSTARYSSREIPPAPQRCEQRWAAESRAELQDWPECAASLLGPSPVHCNVLETQGGEQVQNDDERMVRTKAERAFDEYEQHGQLEVYKSGVRRCVGSHKIRPGLYWGRSLACGWA